MPYGLLLYLSLNFKEEAVLLLLEAQSLERRVVSFSYLCLSSSIVTINSLFLVLP